ncbi:MurR/RpiR family transcriptional regulator [Atopococcus tabaci]|uniref:MurR/RpiR family transcriptional regulator n=1 Tax=Atopococcus tabaci TaxID=269774 RepID=UPI00240A2130|nr:MurR/RpiR family transcriptional regulator [Atopococcus tabaci]
MAIETLISEYYEELNATDRSIAAYILNNRAKVSEMTIRELAEECHSSKSTVLRFIKKIGISGFSELKYGLKWEKSRIENETPYKEDLINDITMNLEQLRAWDMDRICRRIESANRVYVYGTGTEQKRCAEEIKRHFWRLQKYMYVIDDEMDLHVLIPTLKEDDLVIIVSLSGNTPSMIPYAKKIAAKNIPLISMTHLRNNQLSQLTDLNIYAFAYSRESNLSLEVTTFSTFFIMAEALFRGYLDYLIKNEKGSE